MTCVCVVLFCSVSVVFFIDAVFLVCVCFLCLLVISLVCLRVLFFSWRVCVVV